LSLGITLASGGVWHIYTSTTNPPERSAPALRFSSSYEKYYGYMKYAMISLRDVIMPGVNGEANNAHAC
nr:hypothetical protein [Tanacetum cinerariifolium]